MCFDIITVNIRVSIRVRGLHLVWWCFWGSFSTSHTIKALDGGEMRWKVPFAIFRLLSYPENMI